MTLENNTNKKQAGRFLGVLIFPFFIYGVVTGIMLALLAFSVASGESNVEPWSVLMDPSFFILASTTVGSIASGVGIVQRKKWGWWLSLALSIFMLGWQLFYCVTAVSYTNYMHDFLFTIFCILLNILIITAILLPSNRKLFLSKSKTQ